jgi:hypothetical protein
LHNNASETDIREYVTKRKISGSTRSDLRLRCRDTFAGLKKTCRKLCIGFRRFLEDRVSRKNLISSLSDLIRLRVPVSLIKQTPDVYGQLDKNSAAILTQKAGGDSVPNYSGKLPKLIQEVTDASGFSQSREREPPFFSQSPQRIQSPKKKSKNSSYSNDV